MFKRKKTTNNIVEAIMKSEESSKMTAEILKNEYIPDMEPYIKGEEHLETRDINRFVNYLIGVIGGIVEGTLATKNYEYGIKYIKSHLDEYDKHIELRKLKDDVNVVKNLHREALRMANSEGVIEYWIAGKTFVITDTKIYLDPKTNQWMTTWTHKEKEEEKKDE